MADERNEATAASDVDAQAAGAAAEAPEAAAASSAPAEQAPAQGRSAKHRREMTGVVLSNKADKTISVRIDRRVKHPVYGKIVRRSSRLAAHDERNECREGDVVTIIETRPISKTKSWRLGRIVERAGA